MHLNIRRVAKSDLKTNRVLSSLKASEPEGFFGLGAHLNETVRFKFDPRCGHQKEKVKKIVGGAVNKYWTGKWWTVTSSCSVCVFISELCRLGVDSDKGSTSDLGQWSTNIIKEQTIVQQGEQQDLCNLHPPYHQPFLPLLTADAHDASIPVRYCRTLFITHPVRYLHRICWISSNFAWSWREIFLFYVKIDPEFVWSGLDLHGSYRLNIRLSHIWKVWVLSSVQLDSCTLAWWPNRITVVKYICWTWHSFIPTYRIVYIETYVAWLLCHFFFILYCLWWVNLQMQPIGWSKKKKKKLPSFIQCYSFDLYLEYWREGINHYWIKGGVGGHH